MKRKDTVEQIKTAIHGRISWWTTVCVAIFWLWFLVRFFWLILYLDPSRHLDITPGYHVMLHLKEKKYIIIMIIKILSISLHISSKFKHHNGHTVCVGPLGSHCFDIVSNFIDLILFHLICHMLTKFSGVESESTVSKFRKRKRKRPFFLCAHVLHKAGTWN